MGFSIKKVAKQISGAVSDAGKDISKGARKVYTQAKSTIGSTPYLATAGATFWAPTTKTIKSVGKVAQSAVHTVGSSVGALLGQAQALQPGVQGLFSDMQALQGLLSNPLGSPLQEASLQTPQLYTPQLERESASGTDNTKLYLIIGAVAVVGIILVMRKR